MSQSQIILQALSQGARLTPLDALSKFGCFRLGARIWDLKQAGYNIEMELVERQGKRVAEYYLKLEPQQLELFT